MTYAVRAWRDHHGRYGITIGTVTSAGYDNYVAEFDLTGREADEFIAA